MTSYAQTRQTSISFVREPAAWVAVFAAAMSVLAAFNWTFLTEEQAALWVALADGIAAIIVAWRVRPIAPSLFTYIITAVAALAMAYGAQVPDRLVAALNTLAVALVFALTRAQQTPKKDPSESVV